MSAITQPAQTTKHQPPISLTNNKRRKPPACTTLRLFTIKLKQTLWYCGFHNLYPSPDHSRFLPNKLKVSDTIEVLQKQHAIVVRISYIRTFLRILHK